MNTTKSQARGNTITTPVRTPRPVVRVAPGTAGHPVIDRRRSIQTGLVFKSLLVMAACLALIGVVAEASGNSSGTAVDSDPPTVFVQTD